MRKYKLPFRVGHHFASDIVDYAKANNIKPLDFPYAQAQRIYKEAVKNDSAGGLPMNEAEFRSTLDPIAIIKNRTSVGGPQPVEMERMLKVAKQHLAQQNEWIKGKRAKINASLTLLDRDFDKLLTLKAN